MLPLPSRPNENVGLWAWLHEAPPRSERVSKVIKPLGEYFSGTTHVRNLGMRDASDTEIWNYARENDFVIVSKDADFHQRSFTKGFPPKVIGILVGNCPTSAILELLRSKHQIIEQFYSDSEASFLPLVVNL